MFAHFFQDEWTDELEQAWADAYSVISGIMIKGQQSCLPQIEDIRSKAKSISEKLLMEMLEEQIDNDFLELVKGKVRKVLLDTLKEESEKILKDAS